MKNQLLKASALTSSLLFANLTFAHEHPQHSEQMNHWAIGVGSYAFVVASDEDDNYDDENTFGGFNINASYAFNNHFQIKGTYFSLEDEDDIRKSTGYDIMAYGGVGFAKSGFKGYGGVGYYSDEWSYEGDLYSTNQWGYYEEYNYDKSFSGVQFGGGLGYNWGPVALDFVLTLRRAKPYESELTRPGTYIAMSGNLSLSYLF